jgi:hypothetical protein
MSKLLKDKLLSAPGDSAPRLRRVQRRIAASVLRQQPVELSVELALIAAARSSQPSALPLAIVSAFQELAELLGAVAFQRPKGRPNALIA